MKYEEMNVSQKNEKLQELKSEVIASFGGRPHTGKETMDLLAIKWAEFKGVPHVAASSDLPEMIPAGPHLKPVTPGGMPAPVMVDPTTGEKIPIPAKVDDAAENVGKGNWAESKVPDVDPLAGITNPVPLPPAKAVRTPL